MLLSLPSFALVNVGTGATPPVPTLQDAINSSLVTLNNGILEEDFIIHGNFDYNVMSTHQNSTITTTSQDNIITVSVNVRFLTCSFEVLNFSVIDLTGDLIQFTNSSFEGNGIVEGIIQSNANSWVIFTTVNFTNYHIALLSGRTTQMKYCVLDASTIYFRSPANQSAGFTARDCVFKNIPSTAISILDGFYQGTNNVFTNNGICIKAHRLSHNGPVIVAEEDAVFTNCDLAVSSIASTNLFVQNSTILNCKEAIKAENGVNLCGINNNTVDNCNSDYAISLTGFSDLTISQNELRNNTSGGNLGALTVANNTGAKINNNIINDGGSNGIRLINVNGVNTSWNDLDNSNCNINATGGENNSYASNTMSYAPIANMFVENSTQINANCNIMEHSKSGTIFAGNILGLDYWKNHMSQNSISGLKYNEDVMANQQIEKGNTWSGNTLGAEHLSTLTAQIDISKYIVRPITAENPSHTPVNWFVDNGQTAPSNCLYFPPGGGFFGANQEEIDGLVVSLDCAALNLDAGYCMWNKMQAYRFIDLNAALLNDTDIFSFYTANSGGILDQLPTVQEVMASLPAHNIPHMDLLTDASGEPTNLDAYLDYMQNQVKPAQAAYFTALETTLDQWETTLNAITTTNTMEADYKAVFASYINHLKAIDLTGSEESVIATLAALCVGDYGPAVYVARSIADLEQISYVPSVNCPSAVRSANSLVVEESNNISIYPNPVLDKVMITMDEAVDEIVIHDLMGSQIRSIDTKGQTKISIDLSNLASGIYWIKTGTDTTPTKIIKH